MKKQIPENDVNNLVFLDESGVNTNITKHYVQSKINKRAVDSTEINTPCNTTMLSSIRLNGKMAHTIYQGGTTTECFAEYFQNDNHSNIGLFGMVSLVTIICNNLLDCYK